MTGRRRRFGLETCRQWNRAGFVEVEILLRRGGRAVRLVEPARQEERVVLVPAQIVNRPVGRLVVAVRLAVPFQHDDAVRLAHAVLLVFGIGSSLPWEVARLAPFS